MAGSSVLVGIFLYEMGDLDQFTNSVLMGYQRGTRRVFHPLSHSLQLQFPSVNLPILFKSFSHHWQCRDSWSTAPAPCSAIASQKGSDQCFLSTKIQKDASALSDGPRELHQRLCAQMWCGQQIPPHRRLKGQTLLGAGRDLSGRQPGETIRSACLPVSPKKHIGCSAHTPV